MSERIRVSFLIQLAQQALTTGANNTTATVYFYKPLSGTVYGDDFYLEKL
ncbi:MULTISPECIES: hypothetical protein [Sphingobacterium]|nr:hypothetical protein [Sphingobacterium multivorum]